MPAAPRKPTYRPAYNPARTAAQRNDQQQPSWLYDLRRRMAEFRSNYYRSMTAQNLNLSQAAGLGVPEGTRYAQQMEDRWQRASYTPSAPGQTSGRSVAKIYPGTKPEYYGYYGYGGYRGQRVSGSKIAQNTLNAARYQMPSALPVPTPPPAPSAGGGYSGYGSRGYGGGGGYSSPSYGSPISYGPQQGGGQRYSQYPNTARWVNELVNWRIGG